MQLSFFLAQRLSFNKQKSFSRFIIRLATAATALSVAAMILTLSFVNGFQQAISEKVFHFWGHLRVQEYEPDKALIAEETPVPYSDSIYKIIKNQEGILSVNVFATKSAVIENKKEIEGVLLKGVSNTYSSKQIEPFILTGKWLDFTDSFYSRDIIISNYIADRLKIKKGDAIPVYFIQPDAGSATVRSLKVCGIYKTGIEEYDKLFAICDIRLIRQMYHWEHNEIGGFEVLLMDYTKMDTINKQLYANLPDRWISRTIKEVYPNIFDWLAIMNVNRNVIFIVMAVVAIINLVTCLLILILERTRMIGVLKSIGARNGFIQSVFLYNALFITGFGTFFGLLFGVGITLLQQATGFIQLDESAYYVSAAPVVLYVWQVILVCVSTIIVCLLSLLLPLLLIKKVSPVKAIQFR